MSEINELEKQLRSWKPRQPSAAISRRLFGKAAPAAQEVPAFRLRWLAPACLAVLLTASLFNQRNVPALTGSVESGRMVALILSNQNAAAYLTGSFPREHNVPPSDTLEWVSGSDSRAIFTPSRSPVIK